MFSGESNGHILIKVSSFQDTANSPMCFHHQNHRACLKNDIMLTGHQIVSVIKGLFCPSIG